jgi:hypothetical protein
MDMDLQEIWTERIRAYQGSDQTMKAWCMEHNLTLHQINFPAASCGEVDPQ